MKPQNSTNIVIFLFLFYLILFIAGILFAYLFGLGWFFLFHAIGILIASSPRLYIPLMSILLKKDALGNLRTRLLVANEQWFVPKSAIVLNIFDIVLTIFAFWKINVPLHNVLLNIFLAK